MDSVSLAKGLASLMNMYLALLRTGSFGCEHCRASAVTLCGVPAAAFHWHSALSKERVKIAMVNFPALWLKAGALGGAGIQDLRLIIKDALR